jgi:hypothetical protein
MSSAISSLLFKEEILMLENRAAKDDEDSDVGIC